MELRPAVDLGKSCAKEHGPHGEDHAATVLAGDVHAGLSWIIRHALFNMFFSKNTRRSTSQSKCIQGLHAATPTLTFDCILQEFCGPEVPGTRQKADLVASFNVLISPPHGKAVWWALWS